jgi:acyl phosphate:glycerol-3-phosphate acyltransferase
MLPLVLFALIGYACGSVPFGLLLTKAAGLGDVRNIGSGNIGATNVLRTGNNKIAALTLLCDAFKGFLPVLAAGYFASPEAALAAAGGAFIGHLFPVWLGFKGGKGVATFIGILFGFYWLLGLIFLAVWLALAFLFRISSLSALLASAAIPLLAWIFDRNQLILPTAILATVIWIMHSENIKRLLNGSESKISFGRKS